MNRQWWQGKVGYQIYPKSYMDTTGNGIGDIRGIINRLDYLERLGVDIIWISPCYVSPLADQGYDIADYYKIDPRFGTNEDLYELIDKAKARNMYIVLDLVVNHCSDEHEWFQRALAYLQHPAEHPEWERYANYFYIEDAVEGREPNNWRSYFGGSVWEEIPGTNKYYLHLFHKKQPDLNWENPALREEIYDMINWWLDKGVAGFRIDAIMNIQKCDLRKNFEADRADGMAACTNMIYEADGIVAKLQGMRDHCFKPHKAFTVGEVFNVTDAQLRDIVGLEDGCFSTMFDFRAVEATGSEKGWYDVRPISMDLYKQCVYETQSKMAEIGFVSTIIENHDEPRGVSRYIPAADLSDTSKKCLATLQFMQRGLPFIYQGQEIGMENKSVTSIDEVDDISARDEYKVALAAGCTEAEALEAINNYSRDNARSPMQWDDSENAGFTTGIPWLSVNPNYTRINAAAQENDPDSVLNYYRQLTALRKNPAYSDTVVFGTFEPYLPDEENLMAFYRRGEGQTLLVLANTCKEPQTVNLPQEATAGIRNILLNNLSDLAVSGNRIMLAGYQAIVLAI